MHERAVDGPFLGLAVSVAIIWVTAAPLEVSMAQATGSDPVQPGSIDGQQRGDVPQMLNQADAYRQYGINNTADLGRHLVSPPHDSAVALYRKVLLAQPGNQRARQGLQDIAAFYANFARRLCDKSLFDPCGNEARNGLMADPDNVELKGLARRADDATRADPTRSGTIDFPRGDDVQQMLNRADAYRQYGINNAADLGRHLVSPPHDSAVALYRKVLLAQPGNQRARQGLQDIAAYYANFARRLCDKNLFAPCGNEARNGLMADPDNVELKGLARRADDATREGTPSR